MGATAQHAHARRKAATPSARRGAADVAAWLATPPSIALALLAMVVLGRPLGALAFPASPLHFWADIQHGLVQPEPTEDARYLLALTAPVLLAALTVLLLRRPRRLAASGARRLATAIEAAVAAALVACYVAQRLATYPPGETPHRHVVYFTLPTLVVAALVAVALLVGARTEVARRRAAGWLADTTPRRVGAAAVALAAIVVTVLPAIVTDASAALTQRDVLYHLAFTYDETMAVFDGRSPLGNFAAQYGSLWPYLVAAAMVPFGASLATFTVSLAAITGGAMLALFAVLRRVTRSALAGLLLFLPVLATAVYRLHGTSLDRFSLVNYFGTMPLRYAGPFALAWLTARHLDGARPRRVWPLFLAGGLVVLNNTDFGIPAVAATGAALLWTQRRPAVPALRRLALEALAGSAAAAALVTALVLIRTGEPPHLWLLLRYSEVFVRGGFGLMPIHPLAGMSTIVFATYAIALGAATVRALSGAPDRLLTGLLAWSAIFGLGSFSYYVGRSIPELVEHLFAGWAFALALLTVVALRAIASRAGGRPRPLELACLVGFGLLVCSLAQTPAPWEQAQRLQRAGAPIFAAPAGQVFVAQHVVRGERVAILFGLGHRIAADLGVENVSPYTGAESMPTSDQLVDVAGLLRSEGGRKLFVEASETGPLFAGELRRLGFRLVAEDPASTDQLWVRG